MLNSKDRAELEQSIRTLTGALSDARAMLEEDNRAVKAVEAASDDAAVKAVADGGTGDKHQQIARGVLAIRERPKRILDAVYPRK